MHLLLLFSLLKLANVHVDLLFNIEWIFYSIYSHEIRFLSFYFLVILQGGKDFFDESVSVT
jgi:hypothetical protein